MKNILLFIIGTAFFFSCNSKTPTTETSSSKNIFIIKNVALVPMISEAVLTAQTIIIQDGKISKIVAQDKFKDTDYPNAIIIDGTGKFLMPGLVEMHAHIPVADNGNDSLVWETMFLYLANGVTTIRGMLGNPYHLELRKQVANGDLLSPRIYTSSPSMNGNSVKTAEEARQKVTDYQKAGYDFLKIHPGIQRAVFDTLVATANEVGIPFSGHVPIDVGIERAIEAGYASIDHLDGYMEGLVPEDDNIDPNSGGFFGFNFTEIADTSKIGALAKATAKAGVGVVPTQTLFTRWLSPIPAAELMAQPEMKYMNGKTLYQWRQSKQGVVDGSENYSAEKHAQYIAHRKAILQGLHQAGATLLLGSDSPQVANVPGFSIHREMQAMVDAGIPIYEVLLSGTINPARFFNQEKEYGSIREGASADLILLNGNPIQDIGNVQKIEGVMVRGTWLSKEDIEEGLKNIEKS